MSTMEDRGRPACWTFYEFPVGDQLLGWDVSPTGEVTFCGRVPAGYAKRMQKAFNMNCRPALAEYGIPKEFEGMLG